MVATILIIVRIGFYLAATAFLLWSFKKELKRGKEFLKKQKKETPM